MEPISFVYWLRGFLEIQNPDKITGEQVKIINEHIDLVLTPIVRYKSELSDITGIPLQDVTNVEWNPEEDKFCVSPALNFPSFTPTLDKVIDLENVKLLDTKYADDARSVSYFVEIVEPCHSC